MIGAIGNCLKKPVFMKGKSTNTVETLKFLEKIVKEFNRKTIRPYLVYDRAGAHRSLAVKAYIEAHFTCLIMPKGSCRFNAQEKVWFAVKTRYRQRLTEMSASLDISELQFHMLVDEACISISNRLMVT